MHETWLAYSYERERSLATVRDAVDRVASHYREAAGLPLVRNGSAGGRSGMLIWSARYASSRWPAWVSDGRLGVATAHVPTGWHRVIGSRELPHAATVLGRALQNDPARVGQLGSPMVLGICDREKETLTLLNDQVGVGRLYEMPFDEGCVWSNRLGALPIFAGVAPEADERGWALLAAGGWFMSDATPIRGAQKVPASSVITVDRSGVSREQTNALHQLVVPRQAPPATLVEVAAEQAMAMLQEVSSTWDRALDVDLSGGRDSRVCAAAAIASEVEAVFRTTNEVPAETQIARALVAGAPRRLPHVVEEPDQRVDVQPLRTRVLENHLMFDGIAPPQAVRYAEHPSDHPDAPPKIAGYGGGIAHAAPFYSRPQVLERIRTQGEEGPLRRLMRFCRRNHDAAHETVYEIARSEMSRTLARGRREGIEGPTLLDYFLLVDRFAFKTGLNRNSSTFSIFTVPAFVRAAFDLTPEQRMESVLHRQLIAHLVPDWMSVPFVGRSDTVAPPALRRPRIWETADAESVEGMLADDSAWVGLFKPDRIRTMWSEAKAGNGHSHHEQVFERLIWRDVYEAHLSRLGRRATQASEGASGDEQDSFKREL